MILYGKPSTKSFKEFANVKTTRSRGHKIQIQYEKIKAKLK